MKTELNPAFRCLAASRDGSRLAAGTSGGSVIVWDAQTGREANAWTFGGSGIASIVQPVDRRWIASDPQGTLWIAEEPNVARSLSCESIQKMILAPDGTQLLALGRDATLRDAHTLQAVRQGPIFSGRVRCAAVSPVGTLFAVSERALVLWRPEDGDVERHDQLAPVFVDFADHARLVVADNEWVDVYQLTPWRRLATMRCFDGSVTCGCVDRAAQKVYVGTNRGVVVPFSLATAQAGRPLPLSPTPVLALAATRHGLAALQEHGIRLLDHGRLDRHGKDAPEVIELAPAKNFMVTADPRSIRIWDLEGGIQKGSFSDEEPLNAVSTGVSPDGSWIAVATFGSSVLKLRRIDSGETSELDAGAMIYKLRIAPSGKSLAFLSTYDRLSLISLLDRKQTIIPGHFRAFGFSNPSGLIAGVTVDNLLKIYDYTGRNTLFTQRLSHDVAALEFSPNETHLGLLDYAAVVHAVNLDTGREIARVSCPSPVDQVRFAVGEEGKLIALGTPWGDLQLFYDGQKLAEINLNKDLRRLVLHEDRLWCASIDSTGPETSPIRWVEVSRLEVGYSALFAYKLSGSAPSL